MSGLFTWFFFALGAALAVSAYRLVNRSVMKTQSAYSYALLVNAIGAVLTVPLIIHSFTLPDTKWGWLLMAISAFMWSGIMVIANLSYKHTPVSRREPISQVELVFLLLLSVLLLGEKITWLKIIGTLFIIGGVLLLTVRGQASFTGWKSKGVRLTVLTGFLFSVVGIVDKAAIDTFSSAGTYAFFLYLFPALILLCFLPGRVDKTKQLLLSKKWFLLLAGTLSVITYYCELRALQLAGASDVYPVLRLGMVFAVLGGMLVFKEEREHVTRKIVSMLLVLVGAALITGSSILTVLGII